MTQALLQSKSGELPAREPGAHFSSFGAPLVFNDIALIPLHPTGYTVIDSEDVEFVAQYDWKLFVRTNRLLYAYTYVRINGKRVKVYLHRLLKGFPPCQVDHEDHNTLNNRKGNLREATHAQNQHNSVTKRKGKWHSRYKGVTRDKKRWRAMITVDGKRKHIGSFKTPREAAAAYDAKALEHFGAFACTNFGASKQ